jgi:hypothetical protein
MTAVLQTAFSTAVGLPLVVESNPRVRGGEGGIRTLGTLSGSPVFETGLINHSSTSPVLGNAHPNAFQPLVPSLLFGR